MKIRPATPADAGAITDVLGDAAEAAYGEILAEEHLHSAFRDVDDSELASWLDETAADEQVVYLVAAVDDEIVGFVQMLRGDRRPGHVEAGTAFLKSLYVASAHWRVGIGSRLLDEAIARLPETTEQVQLAVLAGNDVGTRFYEQYDFEQTGRGAFGIGDTNYETAIYRETVN